MIKLSLLYTSARENKIFSVIEDWLNKRKEVTIPVEIIVTTDKKIDFTHKEFFCFYSNVKAEFYTNKDRPCCVDGWNLAAQKATGDIFIQVQDDLSPCFGWDVAIARALDVNKEQVLAINDPLVLKLNPALKDSTDFMCHAICTKKYYNQFGYLFHPSYESVYCDNEYSEVAKNKGVVIKQPDIVFDHDHEKYKRGNVDRVALIHESEERYRTGKIIFDYRKTNNFNWWVYPPRTKHFYSNLDPLPRTAESFLQRHQKSYEWRERNLRDYKENILEKVTFLIPTLEKRQPFLDVLVSELQRQGLYYILDYEEGITIGAKRNKMLESCNSSFCSFLDDDDWIPADLREVVEDKINANPDLDVIVSDQMCFINQGESRLAVCDKDFDWIDNESPVIKRSLLHKHIWKTDLAKSVKFPDKQRGEDYDWSMEVSKLVKNQVRWHGIGYFYEFLSNNTETQK